MTVGGTTALATRRLGQGGRASCHLGLCLCCTRREAHQHVRLVGKEVDGARGPVEGRPMELVVGRNEVGREVVVGGHASAGHLEADHLVGSPGGRQLQK